MPLNDNELCSLRPSVGHFDNARGVLPLQQLLSLKVLPVFFWLWSVNECVCLRDCFLTETEGSSQSSDDSHSIFRVCAELQQHGRESVPFTLQLKLQKHTHKVRIAHRDTIKQTA